MTAHENTTRVIVVGGSQAGVLTALALRTVGCDVRVLERSEQALKDRGAGINLHQDLRALLEHRAHVNLDAVSCPVSIHQFLGEGDAVVHSEPRDMVFSSWNALFQVVYAALDEVPYRLGSPVVGCDVVAERATVTLGDGSRATADLVVFADGVFSTGRAGLRPDAPLAYAGYVVWRGCVPETRLSESTRRLLDGTHTTCLLDRSHMNLYMVPGRVGREREVNFVWYRPVSERELPMLLTDKAGRARPGSVPPGGVQREYLDELRASALDLLPPSAAEVVCATPEPFIQAIYDLEVDRMAFDRVCILGDAAFLARPHLGAGTAKAAENAWALGDAISNTAGDVAEALAIWEPGELILGRAVVGRSRRLGERLQSGDLAPDDAEYGLEISTPLRPDAVADPAGATDAARQRVPTLPVNNELPSR